MKEGKGGGNNKRVERKKGRGDERNGEGGVKRHAKWDGREYRKEGEGKEGDMKERRIKGGMNE